MTTLERTLVDLLHSPEHGGGWEEIWRSLESVEFFDLSRIIEHACQTESSLTIARVGFYLDQHREELMVGDVHLDALAGLVPKQPSYMDRRRVKGRLVHPWNLIVPEMVLRREWEEQY